MTAVSQDFRRKPDTMRDLERRAVAHLAHGGTTDLANAPLSVSPSEYTDPARYEAERRELFAKLPLLACLSLDVAEPGDSFTFDAAGPAILIVRGQDRKARAFLNMCTHRGARLVTACERRKLMVCPFHAWSFDTEGRLVGVPGETAFEGMERAARGLVRVPVGEWGGMIFVKAHAGEEEIDVEAWLGDMGPQLLALDLAGARPIKQDRVDAEANWKYCLDTYGEAYHFSALHTTTFGQTTVSNVALYDGFGPHYRVLFTNQGYRDYVGQDEAQWPVTPYGGSHFIFPNSIIYGAPAAGGGSLIGMYRLYPGESVGKSFTLLSVHRGADAPAATPDQAFVDAHDYIVHVVSTEDYSVSREGQRNLEHAPLGFEIVFGRNEAALQNTHRHLAEVIGMPLDQR
ncbi:aromatic ring-hydroxylating dioxygenase subunit alpha [Phenylobacterium sp. LjRoot225]|uniref:aromatic ring-hydroxylating oxygenase subunit alpha n=1 Tax=Phenylobacterium sp. LjRoot225 TaxID=3342285 RepID=UPI003ECE21F8